MKMGITVFDTDYIYAMFHREIDALSSDAERYEYVKKKFRTLYLDGYLTWAESIFTGDPEIADWLVSNFGFVKRSVSK
jgi:tRNA splicing ligase